MPDGLPGTEGCRRGGPLTALRAEEALPEPSRPPRLHPVRSRPAAEYGNE